MQEYVITPETTYILTVIDLQEVRRVFTDGAIGLAEIEPSYLGYSIGRWIDEEDTAATPRSRSRHRADLGGPRALDHTGLPMHFDNQSIFKERFYLDRADPTFLHDEITIIDHALTRPWTVDKKFKRSADPRPVWLEYNCAEGNEQIVVGKEKLFQRGRLPDAGQERPGGFPDSRYFKKPTTGK